MLTYVVFLLPLDTPLMLVSFSLSLCILYLFVCLCCLPVFLFLFSVWIRFCCSSSPHIPRTSSFLLPFVVSLPSLPALSFVTYTPLILSSISLLFHFFLTGPLFLWAWLFALFVFQFVPCLPFLSSLVSLYLFLSRVWLVCFFPAACFALILQVSSFSLPF